MTVRELIELNDNITDLVIEVRKVEGEIINLYHIGAVEGKVGKCPQKNDIYIEKSINAWDDGAGYHGIKPNRIPKNLLNLEVKSFHQGLTYRDGDLSGCESVIITTYPDGYCETDVKKQVEPRKCEEELAGQMQITDYPEVLP